MGKKVQEKLSLNKETIEDIDYSKIKGGQAALKQDRGKLKALPEASNGVSCHKVCALSIVVACGTRHHEELLF